MQLKACGPGSLGQFLSTISLPCPKLWLSWAVLHLVDVPCLSLSSSHLWFLAEKSSSIGRRILVTWLLTFGPQFWQSSCDSASSVIVAIVF